jgi:hypothetical protein
VLPWPIVGFVADDGIGIQSRLEGAAARRVHVALGLANKRTGSQRDLLQIGQVQWRAAGARLCGR